MNGPDLIELQNPLLGCDFRLVKATLEQKLWMVEKMIQKLETAGSIAKKYHISRKQVHKMLRRRLKGIPVRLKGGRPRVLDPDSHVAIGALIDNNSCCNIDHLKGAIRTEYKASHSRRYPVIVEEDNVDEDAVKVPLRSLKRYVTRLHPGVFSIPDDHHPQQP